MLSNKLIFADPLVLFALFILPALAFYEIKRKKQPVISYPSLKVVSGAIKNNNSFVRFIPLILRLISSTFLLIALARPQYVKGNVEVFGEGINIILAIDTSGSMRAIDLEIDQERATRLAVVKKVVSDFILRRKNDPIGLVIFGTEAFTQSPLTLDYSILTEFLKSVEIGIAGENTAVGNALGLSIKRLKDTKAKSKIVILLTDGTNNSGLLSPERAAEIAREYGIKVYTVGVGIGGDVPFVEDGLLGPQIVTRRADLDEQTLKMIAEKTGGKYYRATNRDELEKIYQDIDLLEKSEVKGKQFLQLSELFPYFLLAALIFLILEVILVNTRLRVIP